MAVSDAILARLLKLHPKAIDLSLGRMWRLLEMLDHPERRLPPVIHVAGTNGKGSVCAYLRAVLEAAGLLVHVYTSPHLVRFHERIRLATGRGKSAFIVEEHLNGLLEECEAANDGEPITFFEITTAAALLSFSRLPADYAILEVGLGGRLDATNVVERPRSTVITMVDYDHQHFLGETLALIAREKAGIIKTGVPCVVAPQREEAFAEIEKRALEAKAPLLAAGREWASFEQSGRLIFQDEHGLLDLPLPRLPGPFQIENAGSAIAAVRSLGDLRIAEEHIGKGLRAAEWPARMQRLGQGRLTKMLGQDDELWLDGGHNASAALAVAQAFAGLEELRPKPLTMVIGMLKSKDAAAYLRPFRGLAHKVVTLAIPAEPNAYTAGELSQIASDEGFAAEPSSSIEAAVAQAARKDGATRILIGGSLYLAGHVLAAHNGEQKSQVTGAAR